MPGRYWIREHSVTHGVDGVRKNESMLPHAVTPSIVSMMCSDLGHLGDGADAEPRITTFARASDALRAALELQASAISGQHDDGTAVRVAIDTGEIDSDDPNATAVAQRCRRLLRAGHPGQVLASSTTVEIARASLDDTLELRDLGTHHVRGISAPVWIWQVDATGATASFPPLRTREAAAVLLPMPDTSFIGREADVAALAELIGRHRVVSVVGAGGCGKTRLAIELALEVLPRFRHGTCWVDLAPVVDPAAIVDVTATAVGLRTSADVTVERIVAHLGQTSVLLLFDNCEHVVDDAADMIATIASACPSVRIVATSREPLSLQDEVVWRIPSLGVPDGTELLAADSGRLLLDRIRRVRPGYEPDDTDRAAIRGDLPTPRRHPARCRVGRRTHAHPEPDGPRRPTGGALLTARRWDAGRRRTATHAGGVRCLELPTSRRRRTTGIPSVERVCRLVPDGGIDSPVRSREGPRTDRHASA